MSLLRRKKVINRTASPPNSVVAILRVLALAIEQGVTRIFDCELTAMALTPDSSEIYRLFPWGSDCKMAVIRQILRTILWIMMDHESLSDPVQSFSVAIK